MKKRVFLAGIIQGSHADKGVHPQDYRRRVRELVEKHVPGAEVYDPVAEYPGSVEYPDDYAKQVFFGLMEKAARADVLIAFLPQASLGTAIEMWEARRAGVHVVAISPLKHNWVIRFVSDVAVSDLEEFEKHLSENGLGTESRD
ncbi:MAG TPA: hypothetical protein ENN09_04110 [Planctomycetes bacterium]|nr:hypothetical protein [Planctomycetota bacterium]